MHYLCVAALWAASLLPIAFAEEDYDDKKSPFKYVIAISIDGLHSSDVPKYLGLRPKSNIAALLEVGYEYTNAYTSAPSDSFPGTLAQFTGSSPKTTGVWYDDIWRRDYFAPGSDCKGRPGAEVEQAENLDYNDTLLFSGGINPDNLAKKVVNGTCQKMYPHNTIRVNTAFEVVRNRGLQTAYADKHPAYDIVRGPSGKGLTVGYFPEITGVPNTVDAVIGYDQLHVDAWLAWLDARTPEHSEGKLTAIPSLFGGNFQCINVAQKTVGYLNGTGNPFSPALLKALDFVDNCLGALVKKLKEKKIYEETLIIVASKHGQAPIDPRLYKKVDPKIITNLTQVPIVSQTSDDIALLFLNKSSDTETAVRNLKAGAQKAEIASVIYGDELKANYGDPVRDPSVPDIIVLPNLGVIYTNSKTKVAEHGGFSSEDRNVAFFVSNPKLHKRQIKDRVYTTQVAPTILAALGIDPRELEGVRAEGTKLPPGFKGFD
ncbi:hypothetical protein GJ744_000366 [Endocarpon pusillum]|uniref:Type I phosphodiesterase/nucleotide pyrophosphatase n=1 Tax=Endocarpon pusillum TaxID=364733 RepID=A0A8H7E720_9EURO|nr:hypothetical protein GJ744_000366 [Endocarpon pusillum]